VLNVFGGESCGQLFDHCPVSAGAMPSTTLASGNWVDTFIDDGAEAIPALCHVPAHRCVLSPGPRLEVEQTGGIWV
jgi:hypothetical protein